MLKNLQEIMHGDVTHATVRLWSDEFSVAEAAAIHNRGQGDPKYRKELEGLLTALDSIGPLEGDRAIAAIAREYPLLLRARRRKKHRALGIAAGILVALGTSLAVFAPWRGADDSHPQRYFTRIGEQQTIELDDGSVVTLNTGGQLMVDYGNEARQLLLERGEAFFDVAEDPHRPFTVDLGVRSVTAIGTAFNIRKHPERYQVAVIDGAVAFHQSTDGVNAPPPPVSAHGQAASISDPVQHLLEAGWVAEFDVRENELKAFRPESVERYQEWRNGMLSFYREPLNRVVQELNRYSRKKILIEDASVMELTVSSIISIEEIDNALIGMEKLLPIEVTRHYDRIVITGSAGN